MTLLAQIRSGLRAVAEPARAAPMQAYMKSTMPYLGVTAPKLRAACKQLFASYPFESAEAWRADVLDVWRTAKYREERYAATELTGLRVALGQLDALPLCREIIVTGAWWDHVDGVSPRIGALLRRHPAQLLPVISSWSTDPDRWLRRSAIICQLAFRDSTDVDLLAEVIVPNLSDREFFVRKAIGWALRQYARTDPDWVRGFVAAHAGTISPLSRREALKHLG